MSGKRIQAFRKQMGWTQARLAEVVGTTRNTIARYERAKIGISKPMAQLLERIMADYERPKEKRER